MGQEVPCVAVLDDTHILTMTRAYRDPMLSNMRCGYSFSRGMRFSNYDLSSIYIILAITLTLTIQDAIDRGNESSKLPSTILWKFINLQISASLYEGTFLLLFVEVSIFQL